MGLTNCLLLGVEASFARRNPYLIKIHAWLKTNDKESQRLRVESTINDLVYGCIVKLSSKYLCL